MKTIKFLTLLSIGMFVISCSGLKVVSDVDPSVDFSKYKTFQYYGWADESDKIMSEFDKDRIEKAFGQEFKKRNLEYVTENGDLMVTLFIVVKEKTEQVANTTGNYYGGYYGGYYGYGPGYGWGPGYGSSTTTITEYDYKEGTLVIDVFDVKDKKLLWECIGSKTIDENPKGRSERIAYAVEQMMKKFPIKPVSTK